MFQRKHTKQTIQFNVAPLMSSIIRKIPREHDELEFMMNDTVSSLILL